MSPLRVTAFGLDDLAARQRYDALFEACPRAFIQQSTWWAEVIAPLGPDRPLFLLAEGEDGAEAGLPLYRFAGPAGAIMTSVPQAGPLGGVFCRDGLTKARRDQAYGVLLSEAAAVAEATGCLALSLITNPLAADAGHYRRHLVPDLEFENFTQWVPVAEVMTKDGTLLMSGGVANRVRRGRREGLCCRRLGLADFAAWYAIHQERHADLGIAPLPELLLRRLLEELEPRGKAFLLGVEHGGELISGGLFVRHRAVCDVFIMSMRRAAAKLYPNYALTDAALRECAASGSEMLNWQSSASRDSGVYAFKAQWKAREAPYSFVTRLLGDPAPLLALGKAGLAAAYGGHYVLPFGWFDQPETRLFRKP